MGEIGTGHGYRGDEPVESSGHWGPSDRDLQTTHCSAGGPDSIV